LEGSRRALGVKSGGRCYLLRRGEERRRGGWGKPGGRLIAFSEKFMRSEPIR